jgi:hypothetical protein
MPSHGRVRCVPRGERTRWNHLQRRQCVYADGYVSIGRLHGKRSGHMHRDRFMSCRGNVQHGDGRVLESERGERHRVQRRQCVHTDGYVPGRYLHREQSKDVHRHGPVPFRRHLQYLHWSLLESRPHRNLVQRRQCLYADRYVSSGHLHGNQSSHVHRHGPVPFRRHLQYLHWSLLESRPHRNLVQRRQCMHDDGHLSVGHVHRHCRYLHCVGRLSRRRDVHSGFRLLESSRYLRRRARSMLAFRRLRLHGPIRRLQHGHGRWLRGRHANRPQQLQCVRHRLPRELRRRSGRVQWRRMHVG